MKLLSFGKNLIPFFYIRYNIIRLSFSHYKSLLPIALVSFTFIAAINLISKPRVLKNNLFNVSDLRFLILPSNIHSHIPGGNFDQLSNNNETSNFSSIITASLLILVITSPKNYERRSIIRQSWGSSSIKYNVLHGGNHIHTCVRTVFLLGQSSHETSNFSIADEATKYGDVLQGNFVDTYKNLTYKTLMGIRWASSILGSTEEKSPRYLLKIDDDTIPNIDALSKKLLEFYYNRIIESDGIDIKNVIRGQFASNVVKSLNDPIGKKTRNLVSQANYLLGNVVQGWKTERDDKNKNYLSPSKHKSDILEPFCTGSAYILPHNKSILDAIYITSQDESLTGGIIPNEDLFITGILTRLLNISLINIGWEKGTYLDLYSSSFIYLPKNVLFVSHIPDNVKYLRMCNRLESRKFVEY